MRKYDFIYFSKLKQIFYYTNKILTKYCFEKKTLMKRIIGGTIIWIEKFYNLLKSWIRDSESANFITFELDRNELSFSSIKYAFSFDALKRSAQFTTRSYITMRQKIWRWHCSKGFHVSTCVSFLLYNFCIGFARIKLFELNDLGDRRWINFDVYNSRWSCEAFALILWGKNWFKGLIYFRRMNYHL